MQEEIDVGRDTHMNILSAQLKDYLLHCRQLCAHALSEYCSHPRITPMPSADRHSSALCPCYIWKSLCELTWMKCLRAVCYRRSHLAKCSQPVHGPSRSCITLVTGVNRCLDASSKLSLLTCAGQSDNAATDSRVACLDVGIGSGTCRRRCLKPLSASKPRPAATY